MVFVLKLITIQGLLKGGKLSIIENKMQKSLLCSDRMATFAPSILETSKKTKPMVVRLELAAKDYNETSSTKKQTRATRTGTRVRLMVQDDSCRVPMPRN